ncbi:MAG: M14 family zinc carboxypeptidase [Ferruginibacter sp.]
MKILLFFFFAFFMVNTYSQLTPFEQSGGMQTATYKEAIAFYTKLAAASGIVSVKSIGSSDAGYPLHLVLISADGRFNTADWHRQKKVVILINNGIHPGEPDGIDASMLLLRDFVSKKIILPQNVTLAIIPVYNIGGALNRNSSTRVNQNGPLAYGFRGNSQNLDLNRDFTKNDSKEAKTFATIFHALNPDIFIDNHVSDGADYQHTMTLIATQYEKLGPFGNFLQKSFEPALYKGMSAKGWDMIPYLDFETLDFNKKMLLFNDPPRYSTGYAALFNTIGFMPETHMLKPFKQRVAATYDLMRTMVSEAGIMAKQILAERAAAKAALLQQKEFALSWQPDTTSFTTINFKGYKQQYSTSAATGLQKLYFDTTQKFTAPIKFVNTYRPKTVVTKPVAYIIPAGWQAVIERLALNNVIMQRILSDTMISVKAYRIESFKSFPTPYESHHKNYNVQVSSSLLTKQFLKGDVIVYVNQAANKYLVEMLEPTGDDSFFAWNFFDGILQQKEGYSAYRWEELAAEELKNNPTLQQKLNDKKAADKNFASDAPAILDFIHKNSKYYEAAHMAYPVYRMED